MAWTFTTLEQFSKSLNNARISIGININMKNIRQRGILLTILCCSILYISLMYTTEYKNVGRKSEKLSLDSKIMKEILSILETNQTKSEATDKTRIEVLEKIYANMSVSNIWLNCSNMNEIEIDPKHKVFHGTRKNTYIGKFRGVPVAVKVVTTSNIFVRKCLKRDEAIMTYEECFHMVHMATMKEILLLHQLKHPGIIKLLGYCVRDTKPPQEKEPPLKHGVIAVYEYLDRYNVSALNFTQRLDFALQLADLLDYMEHSPLGSLHIADFTTSNIRVIDGQLKVSDIDLMFGFEQSCNTRCPLGVECVDGRCIGLNTMKQMHAACRTFFKELLRDENNEHGLELELKRIRLNCYDSVSAADMRKSIKDIITNLDNTKDKNR